MPMFGRKKEVEPPVEPVGWEQVGTFLVTDVERPWSRERKRAVTGRRAVRVPSGADEQSVLAPCAYVGPGPALALYEDPDSNRLLCALDAPVEVDGDRHHVVRDAYGASIGTVLRIPPKRPFKHTWRIDQPGHPTVVGRNEIVSGDSKAEFLVRGALKASLFYLDSALGGGDGARPRTPRTLEWKTGSETVMLSQGSAEVTVKADWLDRRLAFAFALVGDS